MIRQYELIDKVLSYNPKANVALLNKAYVYSMKAHGNQKRASGEPYLTHPLAVADILADLKLDDASIAVGLLHDTLEDTLSTFEEIEELFGRDVAELTDGVTKLSMIKFDSKKQEQAENFRKLLMAMSKDIRVLLIKLGDRLHNIRTLHHVPKVEKRVAKAQETMDIFVPLADRIGLYTVKTELEDSCFKVINPTAYEKLEEKMNTMREEMGTVEKMTKIIQEDLNKAGLNVQVVGREKTIFSIHRKMQRKHLKFEQLTDIIAYRVITNNKQKCYEVLGHLHDKYKAIPGRFKDYISSPKPNGYQSLHTSVIGPTGDRVEIQIRTQEMHDIAENGVAAHWLYKMQSNPEEAEKQLGENIQYKWLKRLIDSLQDTKDPEEFLENAKLDLFSENTFVFTPKGDLVSLKKGATPLDFAYSIHSEIGNQCQTAKVNGRVVPLRTQLQNGDQVSIVTNKAQHPSPAWRNFVVTGRAKSAINRYLHLQQLDEQIRLGKEILEKIILKDDYPTVTEKDLTKVLKEVGAKEVQDVYLALAQGRLFPRQVLDLLFPHKKKERAEQSKQEKEEAAAKKVNSKSSAVAIDGLTDGISIHIAKCCSPLPGEEIVGIVNTGRGVTIHAKNCDTLEKYMDEPERWLNVSWSGEQPVNQAFEVRFRITIQHQPGALSALTTCVFNQGGNITDLQMEQRGLDSNVMLCAIEVKDVSHFKRLSTALGQTEAIVGFERLKG